MGFLNICGVVASDMTSHQILEATIRRQCVLTDTTCCVLTLRQWSQF
jgi:hypothetical protein